jgi:hypothetical protein
VAGKAGAFVKANPGKTGLIVAGIGAAGYVGKNLLDADRESTQRLLKSKAFKDYAKSEGKFRERAKI